MRFRPFIVVFLSLGLMWISTATVSAQVNNSVSPHGKISSELTCKSCHTSIGWKPLRSPLDFNHGEATDFALLGRHGDMTCLSCHGGLRLDTLVDTGTDCANCHTDVHDDYFVRSCDTCHSTDSFQDVDGLLIHSESSFPLSGAHETLSCESCHEDGFGSAFLGLETTCISCHDSDYTDNGVIDHVGLGFPVTCENCHGTLVWQTTTFDHASQANGFDLIGSHDVLSCENCHSVPDLGLLFTPVDQNDCVSCHGADYDREHGGSSIPVKCVDCHSVDSWGDAVFDHAERSGGFALVGAHEVLSCENCHRLPDLGLLFTPANQDECITCHQSTYDDNHGGTGFPTTCLDCHDVTTWANPTFEHALVASGFDLVGAHEVLSCENCHTTPDFGLLFSAADQNDCVACHRSDYDAKHTGSGFPTTCLDCHSTDTWANATFDHAQFANGFGLVGAHEVLECQSCHATGDFSLLFSAVDQNDCVACHRSVYDAEHTGSGFPLTCLDCHTTNTWRGATFDHDIPYFPIFSGKHKGEWDSCQTCHTAPSNFTVFTCLSCHEHNQAKMNSKHSGVSNYAYDSASCFSCHPDGKESEDGGDD